MKLSLNWLKQYMDHSLSPEELAHRLTMAGLEVETIQKFGDDVVFEIEVTPNRPDCLSILGLAREVSAILDKDLRIPEIQEHEDSGEVDITIEDPDACGRYIGTVIEGVSVKSIPADKAKLLQALDANTINNIVDITNFTLFELGQPLHAFDLDKLEGGKIVVRRARKGEKIVTLDDVVRELDHTVLVIADAKKPVAIAGIMGGRDTGVTSTTKRILLESAYFDLGVVRRGCRKLGMTSDAAYRFERGVAWKTVETGSNRTTDLILSLAGGKVVGRKDAVAKNMDLSRREVSVSLEDVQKQLGAPLELTRAEKILKRLGCIVSVSQNKLNVITPHYRNDLKIKEDIVEELARVVGYDNLPMSLPQVSAVNIPVDLERERFFNRAADGLVGQGLHQIMTYALISREVLRKARYEGSVPIALQNPMSTEQEIMRPTMLPGFLTVAADNIHRGQKDLKLFEVAKRYLPEGERWTLGILMAGKRDNDWRRAKKEAFDLYDVKGSVEELCAKLRIKDISFFPSEKPGFEPDQCAEVLLKGKAIGQLGRVDQEIVADWDIKKSAIYFAEVDLESVRDAVAPNEKYVLPVGFPAVTRDLSLSVREGSASFAALKALCEENGKGLLQRIDFVELYTGDKIEIGCKGYVLSLTYQSEERTLTDDEVNKLHEGIIQKLIEKFGVKQR